MARSSTPFRWPLRLFLALPVVALGACSGDRGRIPSLEIRPAERAFGQVAAAPGTDSPAPAPTIPADASLPARLTALTRQASEADSRFAAQEQSAGTALAAARKSAVDSEAWMLGQLALARLESARSDTAIALAELDTLANQAAIDAVDRPGPDAQTIATARDSVAGTLARQDAVLDRLRG